MPNVLLGVFAFIILAGLISIVIGVWGILNPSLDNSVDTSKNAYQKGYQAGMNKFGVKRKNSDKPKNDEKRKNDNKGFVALDGTPYEIIEDDISGSIKAFPVPQQKQAWYMKDAPEVVQVPKSELDSEYNYEESGVFQDGTLLVEMPVAVQDWEGFPRGAHINNSKDIGDVVQLIDGRWVEVEEVLDSGKYRMRVIDEPDMNTNDSFKQIQQLQGKVIDELTKFYKRSK